MGRPLGQGPNSVGSHIREIHAADLPGRAGPEPDRARAVLPRVHPTGAPARRRGPICRRRPARAYRHGDERPGTPGQARGDRRPVRGDQGAAGRLLLVDASDLDEAIAIAAPIPMAPPGPIEVPPVIHITDLAAD